MQDEKALQLFNKILEKTRSRALSWEATAQDDQYIATIGPGLVLKLWPFTYISDMGEEIGPPSVSLNDEKNTILLMSRNIDGIEVGDLQELLTLAKRIALNIDKSVDDAIERLSKLVGEGDPF